MKRSSKGLPLPLWKLGVCYINLTNEKTRGTEVRRVMSGRITQISGRKPRSDAPPPTLTGGVPLEEINNPDHNSSTNGNITYVKSH